MSARGWNANKVYLERYDKSVKAEEEKRLANRKKRDERDERDARVAAMKDKNLEAGNTWVARFGARAKKVVGDVVVSKIGNDRLSVPVYKRGQGIEFVDLEKVLSDPGWRNGARMGKRGQAEVLDATYIAWPIYEFLNSCVASEP